MKRIILLFLGILLFICSTFYAQENRDEGFSVMLFGNSIIPLASFADNIGNNASITRRFGFDIGEEAGLSKIGFGFGLELNNKVFNDEIAWVVSAKLLVNPTDVSKLTSFFRDDLKDTVNISFENGNWINIPIFTGFNYYYSLNDKINLYGTIQGGINLTKQASRKAFVDSKVVEETKYNLNPDFGFEVGFGVELLNKYNIGVRYINLGKPNYEGIRKLNETFFTSIPQREMNIDGDKRPVSMLIIFLGYNL